MKKIIPLLAVISCLFVSNGAMADEKLKIVATLSSYADVAKSIGADRVEVEIIAKPRFNPHFIEPRPSDVLRVKECDLFIHSGLDLEAWRDPLLNAAGRPDLKGKGEHQLDLSVGIPLLEIPAGSITRAEGDIHLYGNPHYWLDPRNMEIVATSIAAKLSETDPQGKELYAKNLKELLTSFDKSIDNWQMSAAPYKGAKLVGYHNEWIYLMNFLGFKMEQFLEPKPGIPPTPKQIELVSNYIKSEGVKAIIQPSFFPTDVAEHIAKETGANVLLLSQNVGELPNATSYLTMMDYNIGEIVKVLKNE